MGRQSRRRKQKRNATKAMRLTKSGCSLPEFTIYWWLKREFDDAEYRAKPFGFELDIYIPSLKCGIEYDGRHWHKDKVDQDNVKDMKCVEHGVRLIRIRDYSLPDTKHADRISFNELTWLELGPVIEQLFLALCRDGIEVDMKSNIDMIHREYEIMTGNELHFANRALSSLADIFSTADKYAESAIYDRLFSGWKLSPVIFVFDGSWFDGGFESEQAFNEFCGGHSYFELFCLLPMKYFVVADFDEKVMQHTGHAIYFGFQVLVSDDFAVTLYVEIMQFYRDDDGALNQIGNHLTLLVLPSREFVICDIDEDWSEDYKHDMITYIFLILATIARGYDSCDLSYIPKASQFLKKSLRDSHNDFLYTDLQDKRRNSLDTEIRFVKDISIRKGPAPVRELSAVTYRRYGTHASPVAHVRRGHYHHFWCGSGEDKHLELRWVEETRVNWHEGDMLQTNVTIVT